MLRRTVRRADERGLVLGSRVVVLSVLAVAVATLAFVFTRETAPVEREIAIQARATPTAAASETPAASPSGPAKPKPKPIKRGEILVEVFNNTGIKGLAASIGVRADEAGWQIVGTDNWYGTIPDTTVYHPPRLERAGEQLALDLGIDRVVPAVDPMRMDRLTIILTGPID